MLGVNWTVYIATVDDKAYEAVRDLRVASARFWLVVVGWLAIVSVSYTHLTLPTNREV